MDLLIDMKPTSYRPSSAKTKSVEPIDKSAWDNADIIDLTSPQPVLPTKKPLAVPRSPLLKKGYTIYGSDEAEEDNDIIEEDEQDVDLFADDMEDEVIMYSPPANAKTFNKKAEAQKRRLIVEEDDDSLSEVDENYVG